MDFDLKNLEISNVSYLVVCTLLKYGRVNSANSTVVKHVYLLIQIIMLVL